MANVGESNGTGMGLVEVAAPPLEQEIPPPPPPVPLTASQPQAEAAGSPEVKLEPKTAESSRLKLVLMNPHNQIDALAMTPFIQEFYKKERCGDPVEQETLWKNLNSGAIRVVGGFYDGFLEFILTVELHHDGLLGYGICVKRPNFRRDKFLEVGKEVDNWLHNTFNTRKHKHIVSPGMGKLLEESGVARRCERELLYERTFSRREGQP